MVARSRKAWALVSGTGQIDLGSIAAKRNEVLFSCFDSDHGWTVQRIKISADTSSVKKSGAAS